MFVKEYCKQCCRKIFSHMKCLYLQCQLEGVWFHPVLFPFNYIWNLCSQLIFNNNLASDEFSARLIRIVHIIQKWLKPIYSSMHQCFCFLLFFFMFSFFHHWCWISVLTFQFIICNLGIDITLLLLVVLLLLTIVFSHYRILLRS